MEVKFPGDAGRYAATILRQVEDDAFIVRYEDGEEKRSKELHLRQSDAVAPPSTTAQRAAAPIRGVRLRARERGHRVVDGGAGALRADAGGVAGRARRGLVRRHAVAAARLRVAAPRGPLAAAAPSVLPAHSDLRNWVLTAHVPLTTPAAPRPGPLTPPPSLASQKPSRRAAPSRAQRRGTRTAPPTRPSSGARARARAAVAPA